MKFLRTLAAGLAVACLAIAASVVPALAQAIDTNIDFSPVVENIIAIVGAALSALAMWIGWYVKNWVAQRVDLTNTQLDEQLQQMYNEAAARAIAYAESVVKGAVPKEIDVKNIFVATAAEYVLKFWPDLVKRVGLTPEMVKSTIIARLPSGPATEKADAIVQGKAEAAKPA